MLSSIHNCNYVRIRSTGCDVPIANSVSGNTAKLTRMRRKHRDAATPQRHGQCAGQPSVSSIPIPSVTVHAFDISPPSSSVVLRRTRSALSRAQTVVISVQPPRKKKTTTHPTQFLSLCTLSIQFIVMSDSLYCQCFGAAAAAAAIAVKLEA